MSYDLVPEDPPAPAPSDLPPFGAKKRAGGDIAEDLTCVHCEYNLRGLGKRGRCPECGTPAALSLVGDALVLSPPYWLATVRNGVGLLVCALLLDLLAVFWQLRMASAISAVAVLAGVWFLTTPEPRDVLGGSTFNLGFWLRLAAVLRALAVGTHVLFPTRWLPPAIATATSIAVLLGAAVFLRRLAERIPDEALERSTTRAVRGFSVALAVAGLAGGISVPLAAAPRLSGPMVCAAVVGSVMAAACALWLVLLLYRYFILLRWAVYEAHVQQDPRPRREPVHD